MKHVKKQSVCLRLGHTSEPSRGQSLWYNTMLKHIFISLALEQFL